MTNTTWLSNDCHMTVTWLSHDYHMMVTWLSHDYHMMVTWLLTSFRNNSLDHTISKCTKTWPSIVTLPPSLPPSLIPPSFLPLTLLPSSTVARNRDTSVSAANTFSSTYWTHLIRKINSQLHMIHVPQVNKKIDKISHIKNSQIADKMRNSPKFSRAKTKQNDVYSICGSPV